MAIDNQLAAVDQMLVAGSPADVIPTMARVMSLHENSRVLMGMAQAADQEPALRALFGELIAGILERLSRWFASIEVPTHQADLDLMHAVTVGLAVIDLAAGRPDGDARTKAVLERVVAMLGAETNLPDSTSPGGRC